MDRRDFLLRTFSGASGALLVGGFAGCATGRPMRRGAGNPRVMGIVRDLQDRTNRFVGTLDRSMDRGRGRLDGTRREDDLNDQARRLENEVDQIQRELNRREDFRDVRGNVRSALDAGRDIDRTMRSRSMGRAAEREWKAVRRELDRLADAYDLPRI